VFIVVVWVRLENESALPYEGAGEVVGFQVEHECSISKRFWIETFYHSGKQQFC